MHPHQTSTCFLRAVSDHMKINKRVRYKINKPLSGLMVFRLIMSLAERLSTKTSHFPPRLCFSAKFWTLSADISALPRVSREMLNPDSYHAITPVFFSIISHGRKQILCVDSSKMLKTCSQLRIRHQSERSRVT